MNDILTKRQELSKSKPEDEASSGKMSKQVPQLSFCSAHNRPLELVCIDDHTRVCHQCALFGIHKGHDVRMEEEVKKEIQVKLEVFTELHDTLDHLCKELHASQAYKERYEAFKQHQELMKTKIAAQFKEWRKLIRDVEMKTIDTLYQSYEHIEEAFTQSKKAQKEIVNKAQAWNEKVRQRVDRHLSEKDPHFIDFELIDNGNHAEQLLNEGEDLIHKCESGKQFSELTTLQPMIDKVKVQFDQNFQRRLEGIAKVTKEGQGKEEDHRLIEDEMIVELCQNSQNDNSALNISGISFNDLNTPSNKTMMTSDIRCQCNSSTNNETMFSNTSSDKSMMKLNNLSSSQQQQQLKSQSKLKTPSDPKNLLKKKSDYAFIFQQDAVDGHLDLSNRGIPDNHLADIAKSLKQSPHIRSLDLSHNKISDESLHLLVKAVCESHHLEQLNLSYNKITEKSVEPTAGILKTNKTLRTLDLRENGISSRLMKNKLKNYLTQIEVIL